MGEVHKSLDKENLSVEDLGKALEKSQDELSKAFEGGGPVDKELREAIENPAKNCRKHSNAARPRCRTRSKRCVRSRVSSRTRPGKSRACQDAAEKGAAESDAEQPDRRRAGGRARRSANSNSNCGDRRAGSKSSSGVDMRRTRHLGASETRVGSADLKSDRPRRETRSPPAEPLHPQPRPPGPPRPDGLSRRPTRPWRRTTRPQGNNERRIEELEEKMKSLLKELENLKERKAAGPRTSEPGHRVAVALAIEQLGESALAIVAFRRSIWLTPDVEPGVMGVVVAHRRVADDSELRMEPSRRSSSLVWMVWNPRIVSRLLEAGQLPNLARLKEQGGFTRVATTRPAQTPVAWSTFATGTNPGGHGIFDFLRRNPKNYLPELALNRYEQKNAFLPPKAVNLRRGTPVWELLAAAGKSSTVLRCPCTYPPDRVRGQMLSGMGVPDLRGGLGTSTFYTIERRGHAPRKRTGGSTAAGRRRCFHNLPDRSPQSQGGWRPAHRSHAQGRSRRPRASRSSPTAHPRSW